MGTGKSSLRAAKDAKATSELNPPPPLLSPFPPSDGSCAGRSMSQRLLQDGEVEDASTTHQPSATGLSDNATQ